MTTALSDAKINEGLAKLNGWSRAGDVLTKSFKFDSYLAGVAFCLDSRCDRGRVESSPRYQHRLAARDGNIHHARRRQQDIGKGHGRGTGDRRGGLSEIDSFARKADRRM